MRTLVAGVGNIFLGDDAFGCEVVRRMADRPVPDGVQISDFGIRGVHLAYQLLDGYDLLVLVDAAPRGREPGTVSLLDGSVQRVLVVACEPESTAEGIGLSAVVAAAVDPAVEIVQQVISGADESVREVSGRWAD
jgi:hydrogenase maturation protease